MMRSCVGGNILRCSDDSKSVQRHYTAIALFSDILKGGEQMPAAEASEFELLRVNINVKVKVSRKIK